MLVSRSSPFVFETKVTRHFTYNWPFVVDLPKIPIWVAAKPTTESRIYLQISIYLQKSKYQESRTCERLKLISCKLNAHLVYSFLVVTLRQGAGKRNKLLRRMQT